MHELSTWFGDGVDTAKLSTLQVLLRAAVIFVASLVLVRFGSKRFFAKKTAFDYLLGVMLASMMARAINGAERIGPTIAAGALLVCLHRMLAACADWWPAFGWFVKGDSETLVREGAPNLEVMRRHHVTKDDLEESMRLKGIDALDKVKLARLERSGEVSVVAKD